ncbi:MAG TPA: hypothetical protein H9742_10840 [Candidatus Acetatifactor stercoripullorum]|uniref:Fibronectin type-III domain-containing protein n=1 Tax=Candidatus Acetatifactor stercoripullorum TaxID=2838414 RepID=A0A9D1UD14_9FIRM|nr:pectinesterase family protein [uncultured Acetatifactor sp.]HIW81990.1 hypothetical protein [Candidatus Acetatifactor stercoripullorum]
MKKATRARRRKRITAWLLAAVMALSAAGVMPAPLAQAQTVSSGDAVPMTVSDGNGGNQEEGVYILNVEDLANGKISAELQAGTSNYFAIGKEFTVEANTKTFNDMGITVTKRMKSSGDGNSSKKYIRFTVSGGKQADIAVCATSSGGGKDAQLVLCNAADDSIVAGTEAFLKDGESVTVTYSGLSSGTYYLISKKSTDQYTVGGNVNFYYVKVSETATVQAPTVNTVTALQDEKKPESVTVTFTGTAGASGSEYVVEASNDGGTSWIKAGTCDGSQSGGSLTVDLSKDDFGYGQWKFRVKGTNQVEASAVITYQAQTYILSGSYETGLGETAASVTGIVFTPKTDSLYEVPEVVLDTAAYTYQAVLEKGTTYEIAVEGVDEYELVIPEEAFVYSQDTTLNLAFEKKVTYPVTISLGATPDLTGMNISYTFVHEDGSEYKFADDSAIMLRNGDYTVSLGGDFEQLPYGINKGSTLTVDGAAVNHVITFKRLTSWFFTGEEFTKTIQGETGYYKGLHVDATAGKFGPNGTPANSAQFNAGTVIQVPVTGACTVAVTAYQGQYALYTINGQAADTSEATTTLEYEGGEGTIEIVSTGSAYIAGITLTYPQEEVIFVPQTVMPFVPEDDGDENTAADTDGIPRQNKKDSMVVQPVGQKLNLTQTGGSFADKFADTQDVAYYLFPMTGDANRLEFDLLVTESKATGNTAGFFGGVFTDNYVYSLGLRGGGQKIRGIYSKNGGLAGGSFAGAGSPTEENVGLNRPIHYVIEMDGDRHKTTITFLDDAGAEQTRSFSQSALSEPDGSTPTEFYYGFALANVSVTITNMVYTSAEGVVLYDQNNCYYPKGTAPSASEVTAAASDTREYIDVTWKGTVPEDDGTYVVEMQKDGGQWTELTDDVTGFSYRYEIPAGEGGSYLFRVCGQLGKESLGGSRTNYAEMTSPVSVLGALAKPVVSITAGAADITLSWEPVSGAEYYQVFRYSYDEGEQGAVCVAQKLTEASYCDTNVTAQMPYYYQVKAVSDTADNESPLSDTVWQLVTGVRTGDYAYEDEATEIFITRKSYDTVFTNQVILEGNVYGAGQLSATVNGIEAKTQQMAAGDGFSFALTVEEGRNDVSLLFTDGSGRVTRKTFNFVYLTHYDIIVDASYNGVEGEEVNGIPTYSTVQAAVDSVPAGNSDRKVILVLAGSYEERLVVDKPNVTLIGEDRENTLIHFYPGVLGENYEAGGDMDKRCAVYIQSQAAGFGAENISFANDYVYATADGKSNKSADAVRVEADNSSFVNVKFTGVQDTLYMHSGKQYYYKCLVEGLIDFIYSGDAARAFFEECELRFVYESTKKSGYVCAPKTASDAAYGLTFYNCVITSEEGCSGTGYLLARPWGPDAYITWIDCYMGKAVNELAPYGAMSGNQHQDARFFEFGSYGPGYAINADRRQISPTKAAQMVSADYLGWNPKSYIGGISTGYYVGTMVTDREPQFDTAQRADDRYLWTDGEDTGLKLYDMEGYAAAYGTSGGGLLKETNDNYYKTGSAVEFLDALLKIQETGKNSVIELTADINLGCNEVENFAFYSDSKLLTAYSAQPLTHPALIESGVSKLNFDGMANLTIFSRNGSSIKHANITMKNSENIIIRNIKFDELWEWDEATEGDYDRNDWDYMTIDQSCDGIWIDHCTFYKAYDGVIDVKNPSPVANVTISWCEFLPGSEGNVFFDVMMDDIFAHPENYPTYQHMLDEGMTKDQVYMYAYGQKKTHLLGQSDDAVNAAGIRVTLANNYYKDSMDRMPRLRYGYSHVYNCIMDAQELLDVRESITNQEIAAKIVSNGAASTCGAQVLLENCYINGIQNALNSGNGSSPSGYINAINSVYYMDGVLTALEPKCNTTGDTRVLVTDADKFITELPYSDYKLYDAQQLAGIIIPRAGAGKLNLTVLQWEKVSYNAQWENPDVMEETHRTEISDILPGTVLTEEIKEATGCNTVEELTNYLKTLITESAEACGILSGIDGNHTSVLDVEVQISMDGGTTWEKATAANFPAAGIDIILPYPAGTSSAAHDFVVGHLITMACNGAVPGTMEYFAPEETEAGLKIHIMSASPFVIGWKEAAADSGNNGNQQGGDSNTSGGEGDNSGNAQFEQVILSAGRKSPKTFDGGSSLYQQQDGRADIETSGETAGEEQEEQEKVDVPVISATLAPVGAAKIPWQLALAAAALCLMAAAAGIWNYRKNKEE